MIFMLHWELRGNGAGGTRRRKRLFIFRMARRDDNDRENRIEYYLASLQLGLDCAFSGA